jgi:hypothetical protein
MFEHKFVDRGSSEQNYDPENVEQFHILGF